MIRKIAITGLIAGLVFYLFLTAHHEVDFDVYLDAASKLLSRQNIYQPPFIHNLQYYYSPLFALILIPFALIPYWISKFCWLLACVYFMVRSWKLTVSYFPKSLPSNYQKAWMILPFIAVLRFIINNIGLVQITPFLLWAVLESFRLFDKKKAVGGAALFGLALNIKLLPLTLLPYLLFRNKIKESLLIVGFFGIFLFLPALLHGVEFNNYLISQWWKIINPLNSEHSIETESGTYGLVALIHVFITSTVGEMPYARNFIDLNLQEVSLVVNMARVIFILITLAFLRSFPFKRETDRLKEIWEISYILAITPLLFPHQHKYAFLFVLPMMIYLYYFFLSFQCGKAKKFTGLFILLIIISILFTPIIGWDIIGRFLYNLSEHYRLISFCVIMLLFMHWWCAPHKLAESKLNGR